MTSFRHADDFVLSAAAQVRAIRFWATGRDGFLASFSGTVFWAIYLDANGWPGQLLQSGVTTSTVSRDTGISAFLGNRYAVSFNLDKAVVLPANTVLAGTA
ncbi:MAG: hypothetical protein ACKV22_33210 [Bryobacteraceae bacterium]